MSINRALHLERRALIKLIDQELIRWIPVDLNTEHYGVSDCSALIMDGDALRILKEARELDKFPTDTFQLLMSTITVMAAESGLKESRSAQKLHGSRPSISHSRLRRAYLV